MEFRLEKFPKNYVKNLTILQKEKIYVLEVTFYHFFFFIWSWHNQNLTKSIDK